MVAEYSVGDDPQNLPIDYVQIETFDFRDAATAGSFHSELKGKKNNISGYNRRIITNDVKILAQIKIRNIDAIISKDVQSYSEYVAPLIRLNLLNIKFIDLNKKLNETLGQLFPL